MAIFNANIPDEVNELIKQAAKRRGDELGARMPRQLFIEQLIKAAAETERKKQEQERSK